MAVSHRLSGAAPQGTTRHRDDFYRTPRFGTEALLDREMFDGPIWEPACGDGAICRVMEERGYQVVATDLIDRGYGLSSIDFIHEKKTRAPNIVTNPPYGINYDFVRIAISLYQRKMAMLLPLRFLEGIKRGTLFDSDPPARLWLFRRRLTLAAGIPAVRNTLFGDQEDEPGSSGGMLPFSWFVWDRSHSGKCELDWI